MKPDICTSLHCEDLGCDYCKECSHAIFKGEVQTNKTHTFEFNPQYGVTFTKKNGSPKAVQPAEKNPVWNKWEEWFNNFEENKGIK